MGRMSIVSIVLGMVLQSGPGPRPPGVLVDIGGQKIHVRCTGSGTPTVILESGLGDTSSIWGLVQAPVSHITRVCSYDRGGYAWSQPGTEPRTFAQLALELRSALDRLGIHPPFVLVGQSYGGLVVRGFAAKYGADVAAVLLVDAVHEDQSVIYGGQPHVLREEAKGRPFPAPKITLDTAMAQRAAQVAPREREPVQPPLDRLPADARTLWEWAATQPLLEAARSAEADWSPEELARIHEERLRGRTSLGSRPLIVLARGDGGYADGMKVPADALERERRSLQADLAGLSTNGRLIFDDRSGHNIHVEDPDLVVQSIRELVTTVRGHPLRKRPIAMPVEPHGPRDRRQVFTDSPHGRHETSYSFRAFVLSWLIASGSRAYASRGSEM